MTTNYRAYAIECLKAALGWAPIAVVPWLDGNSDWWKVAWTGFCAVVAFILVYGGVRAMVTKEVPDS